MENGRVLSINWDKSVPLCVDTEELIVERQILIEFLCNFQKRRTKYLKAEISCNVTA